MQPHENAKNLIEKYFIKSPAQLNLEEILYAENLRLITKPLDDCEGKIIFDDELGIITLNSNITDDRQKRFTLAHEMGHFFNEHDAFRFYEKYVSKKYSCGFEEFYGKKNNAKEKDANEFAGELLMYKPWFQDFIRNKPVNFDLIKEVSEYFNVSLTAAAIRYVFIGQYPVALILSKNGKVVWSAINEYFPLKYIPVGYKVRKESAAYDYFIGKETQADYDLVSAQTWFGEDYNSRSDIYFYEQNIVMYNYNCVLTLLWEW